MTYIVDRRLHGKNKSSVNRQRFLQRYRAQIQKAVFDAVTGRKLTDLDTGEKITIPKKEISEPLFQHGTAGNRRRGVAVPAYAHQHALQPLWRQLGCLVQYRTRMAKAPAAHFALTDRHGIRQRRAAMVDTA